MDWGVIIDATIGREAALNHIARRATHDDDAALISLLLLEEAPHPMATLVAVVGARPWTWLPLIRAALAPQCRSD